MAQVVSLSQMVQECIDILKFKAEQKGLQLQGEVLTDIDSVQIDGMRTKQIVINLVSNAIKYT